MNHEKQKKMPQRMCVACRTMRNKDELIRIIKLDGGAKIDTSQKSSGRGAYVCKEVACIKKCIKTKALVRHLGAKTPQELEQELILLI